MKFACAARSRTIDRDDNGKLVLQDSHGTGMENVDEVIYAIGRNTDLETLQLENAGIEANARGYLEVDLYQRTSQPHIFALGDVTGRAPLTPVAIAAGRQAR